VVQNGFDYKQSTLGLCPDREMWVRGTPAMGVEETYYVFGGFDLLDQLVQIKLLTYSHGGNSS
jgi:hypothetical protein